MKKIQNIKDVIIAETISKFVNQEDKNINKKFTSKELISIFNQKVDQKEFKIICQKISTICFNAIESHEKVLIQQHQNENQIIFLQSWKPNSNYFT